MPNCPHCNARLGLFDELRFGVLSCRTCGEDSYRDKRPTRLQIPLLFAGVYPAIALLVTAISNSVLWGIVIPTILIIGLGVAQFIIRHRRPLLDRKPESAWERGAP